jgi:5'(3')-deoxyribonucleotidase
MDIMNREGLYRHLGVITGAREAVTRLRERYDVVVLSSPPTGSKTAEDEKREWLAEHFDTDFAEEAIITRQKHLIIGRLLIEDNPDIARDASWQPIVFHQPYNRHVTDLPRMYGWGDLSVVEEEYAKV